MIYAGNGVIRLELLDEHHRSAPWKDTERCIKQCYQVTHSDLAKTKATPKRTGKQTTFPTYHAFVKGTPDLIVLW